VLEVEVHWLDELVAVEEPADRDLHALDLALELEPLHAVAPRLLVGAQHVDDVAAVVVVADVQQALDVLNLAEGLYDVRPGVLADVLDARLEVRELLVVDGVDAVLLQDFHRVAAVLLQSVGVRGAPDDGVAVRAQFLGERAGTDVAADPDVVEDDDVGPVEFGLPVVGLRDEPVGYLLVGVGPDVVFHVVAFLVDLPRHVADERRVRGDEQKLRGLHAGSSPRATKRMLTNRVENTEVHGGGRPSRCAPQTDRIPQHAW